jgi:hypothetical protein
MKKRQHTPEQIIRKLAEGEKLLGEGRSIGEVAGASGRVRRALGPPTAATARIAGDSSSRVPSLR